MKRFALVGIVLGVLLVADGIYMVATKYNGGETQAWNLPDGWIIVISAAILLVASILAYVLPSHSQQTAEPVATPSQPVTTPEVGTEQG